MILCIALILVCPVARAATVTDVLGDASDGQAGYDITQLEWNYDPSSGTASGTLTVAGATTSDALAFILLGTPGPDGRCSSSDSVAFGGYLDATRGDGVWQQYAGGVLTADGAAVRNDTQLSTGFIASDVRLAGKSRSCAVAKLADPADTDTIYDEVFSTVTDPVDPGPIGPGPTEPVDSGPTDPTPEPLGSPSRSRSPARGGMSCYGLGCRTAGTRRPAAFE